MFGRRRGPSLLVKKAGPAVQTDFTVKICGEDFLCSRKVLEEIIKNPDIDLKSSNSVSLNIEFDGTIKLSENNKFKSAIKSILNGEPTFIYDKNLKVLIDHLKINNLVTKEAENQNEDEMKWLIDVDQFFSSDSVDIENEGQIGNEEMSIDDETLIWLIVGKIISDQRNAEKYMNLLLGFVKKRGESFVLNLKRVIMNSLKNAVENGTEVKMIFELIFIVRRLYEAKIVSEKDFDLNLGNRLLPATFIDIVQNTNRAPFKVFNSNYDSLSQNGFSIHKELCHNGVNPDDIYNLIRNDNVEEFDKITSTITNIDNPAPGEDPSFVYNKENYMKSAYERCTYVNNDFMCYVDISAYFGSSKIFNYLINDKKARLTSKTAHYAIASGNKEIIDICEKNGLSFDGTLTEAIQFHQYDLFQWLVKDKKLAIDNCFDTLITSCLQFSSFRILNYLLDYAFLEAGSNIELNCMNIIEQSCKWGNFPVLRHILKNVLISRPFQGDNINAFHLACQNGNPDIVRFLCQQSFVELNHKVMSIIGSQGWTGLHFAASKGNTEAVRILLECPNIEINSTTSKNQTAVHLACERSITETIKILVENPSSDLSIAMNSTQFLPIHISCQRGNSDAVSLILNSKKNYGSINSLSAGDMTPLHLGCINGNGEVVRLVCAVSGVDLNLRDFENHNALQLACIHGHIDCVKVLIAQPGIDVNAVCKFDLSFLNNDGEDGQMSFQPSGLSSPGGSGANNESVIAPSNTLNGSFHFSCLEEKERRGSANFPLVFRPSLTKEGSKGITPAPSFPVDINDHHALTLEPKEPPIQERRPSLIAINLEEEMNVLFFATITSNLRLFKALVGDPKTDVNAVNKSGMAVIHICARQNQPDFVRILLARKDLSVNLRTSKGMTPLHFAAKEGNVEVVRQLVAVKGIELNPLTTDGKLSPLHLACERGRTAVVKLLSETPEVDLTLKTASGQTPVQIACQNGYSDIFAILSQNNDLTGLRRGSNDGSKKPQFGPQSLSPKAGKITFGPSKTGPPKKGGIVFGPK